MLKNTVKYRWLTLIIQLVVIFVFVYGFIQQRYSSKNQEIKYDAALYYHYLPAIFIYQDFTLAKAEKLKTERLFFLNELDNGAKVSKMTMGWAVLNTPAFLLADSWVQITGAPRDELSTPYIFMIMLNLLIFALAGMYFLQKFLQYYMSPLVAAFSMALIMLGSNIPYYTLVEPMTHVFGFSLFCCILYITKCYITKPTFTMAISLGLIGGLFVLLRPTNFLLLLIPLGLFVQHIIRTKNTLNLLHVAILFASMLFIAVPQIAYWYHMTGRWLIYSYTYEAFHFNNPEIIKGLFSFRKGWVIYSPIVAVGLIGMMWAVIKKQSWALLSLPVLMLFLYVTFSWWCWWYGGGLGSRATIEFLPIIALGLGFFVQQVFQRFTFYVRMPLAICLLTIASLGLFFNWQYNRGLLHWDGMTKEAYKAVFLQTLFPPNYETLIDPPDYAKALENED